MKLSRLFSLVLPLFVCLTGWSEPPNLGLLKKNIIQYHDSGAYQQELTQVINKAHQYLIQQANASEKQKKLALVLDIDETSLSNYKSIIHRDFTGNRRQIHKEIITADAPAIAPMLKLYNDARKHHIKVFFVTGRTSDERSATIKNLNNAGYHDWAGLYLRPLNYHDKSIIPFKSQARADITKKGYVILASIGDQYSDIKGGYAEKGFKLPNPFYYLP